MMAGQKKTLTMVIQPQNFAYGDSQSTYGHCMHTVMNTHNIKRKEITILMSFLLCDSLWYVILRRIIPGPKYPFATYLFRKPVSTMATSGFGPYHGLWLDDTPTKHIGVIHG
jgi:hypothetical protein